MRRKISSQHILQNALVLVTWMSVGISIQNKFFFHILNVGGKQRVRWSSDLCITFLPVHSAVAKSV